MFNLEDYQTVDERIHRFWNEFANGRIVTELLETVRGENGQPFQYVVKALIYRNAEDPAPSSTGYAEEIVGSSPVNKISALENAETSAIGRALANMGLSTRGQRPSQTEMQKVETAQTFQGDTIKGNDLVIKQPNAQPSEKQTALLQSRSTKLGVNSDFYNEFWRFCLAGGILDGAEPITKGEASQLIGMDKTDFEGYAAAFFGALLQNKDEAPF